jgi:hypothetical protein
MSGAANAPRRNKIITCTDCGKNFEGEVMLNIHVETKAAMVTLG